jgi:hypothetical protein
MAGDTKQSSEFPQDGDALVERDNIGFYFGTWYPETISVTMEPC